MKQLVAFYVSVVSFLAISINVNAQVNLTDTSINVGQHSLHFTIIKGQGIPVLFEAGGGDNATVWKDLLEPIHFITGTTLITYDRSGFGKTGADSCDYGIADGVKNLGIALHQLGYDSNIILTAHSFGALYSTLYACEHPDKVKAAVFIDASSACSCEQQLTKLRTEDSFVKNIAFPLNIPVTDFVSEFPPFQTKKDIENWKLCHKTFAALSPNRELITAYGCGHYIFQDNPYLIINAIVNLYSKMVDSVTAYKVLQRSIDYAVSCVNELKKVETKYRHSEDDLNTWGYALLKQNKIREALEVFELNISLFPQSWNVYDSYGEALLKSGRKQEAIKMYKKSVELNPNNDNGKQILKKLLGE